MRLAWCLRACVAGFVALVEHFFKELFLFIFLHVYSKIGVGKENQKVQKLISTLLKLEWI